MPSSDKYLQQARNEEAQRRAQKITNRKKKKRRKGKKGPPESDSENEIPVLHSVSTAYDAPEVSPVIYF